MYGRFRDMWKSNNDTIMFFGNDEDNWKWEKQTIQDDKEFTVEIIQQHSTSNGGLYIDNNKMILNSTTEFNSLPFVEFAELFLNSQLYGPLSYKITQFIE